MIHPPDQDHAIGPEARKSTLHFWVRANGHGLSLDEFPSLFTPLGRLHQIRSQGQRLGLSIVRRIVDRVGGQVGARSRGIAGEGCTFYFTLPTLEGDGAFG